MTRTPLRFSLASTAASLFAALFFSFAALAQTAYIATDTDLIASATTLFPQGVWRRSYASGIGSPLFFRPLVGTCAANSLVNDGGSCRNNSTGNSWAASSVSGVADVQNFGADPTGAADATAAIRAALAASLKVYVPQGTYKLTDMLTMRGTAEMTCADRADTNFSVDAASFNMAAQGVVKMPVSDAVTIIDCGFYFVQPDTAIRANINAYPPAIYAQGATRFYIDRVRVSAGYTCLDARGNTGGARIGVFECGALATADVIAFGGSGTGALDFVHIDSIECWPFGIAGSASLMAVYSDYSTDCASIGKVDGLVIDKIASFRANIIVTTDNHGAVPLSFGNISLDVGAMFEVDGGFVQVSRMYYTHSGTPNPAIFVNGTTSDTRVTIADIQSPVSMIDCPVKVGGHTASLAINGGRIVHTNADYRFSCFDPAATSSSITIRNMFFAIPNTGRTACLFDAQPVSSDHMVLQNNQTSARVTGTGNIVCIGFDTVYNEVSGNSFSGWSHSLPFLTSLGYYDIAEPFTPGAVTPTFTTPGDFSPTVAASEGWYVRRGDFVELGVYSAFDENAYTTASGSFYLTPATGWPSPLKGAAGREGCILSDMEKVTVSSQVAANIYDSSHIYFRAFTSAAASSFLNTSKFPASTTGVILALRCNYRVR